MDDLAGVAEKFYSARRASDTDQVPLNLRHYVGTSFSQGQHAHVPEAYADALVGLDPGK